MRSEEPAGRNPGVRASSPPSKLSARCCGSRSLRSKEQGWWRYTYTSTRDGQIIASRKDPFALPPLSCPTPPLPPSLAKELSASSVPVIGARCCAHRYARCTERALPPRSCPAADVRLRLGHVAYPLVRGSLACICEVEILDLPPQQGEEHRTSPSACPRRYGCFAMGDRTRKELGCKIRHLNFRCRIFHKTRTQERPPPALNHKL